MKFRKAYIEITNQCNLSCAFCPKTSREPRFMDEALFDAICSQLAGCSQRLYFHVMGEPLLHPRLAAFLDICARYNHNVYLVTNGMWLAKRHEDLVLKPALRQLCVSVRSCVGQLNEEEFRSYFDAVKNIADTLAKNSGATTQLRLWNKGVDDLAYQTMLFRLIQETFGLSFGLEDALGSRRALLLGKNLCIDSSAPFEWPSLNNKNYGGRGTCYGLRRQCAILADGTVTACCLDNNGILNLGAIRERSLTDILSGKRAIAIRQGFERGVVVEELCRKCSYRLRFTMRSKKAAHA